MVKYSKVLLCLVALVLIPLVAVGCKAKTTTTPVATPVHVMTNMELMTNLTTTMGTVSTQGGAITALAGRVGTIETSRTDLTSMLADIAALQTLTANIAANQLKDETNISALQSTDLALQNTTFNLNASVWALTHLPAVPPVITETLSFAPTWSNASVFVFCTAKDSVTAYQSSMNYSWSADARTTIVPWLQPSMVLWYLPTDPSGTPISGTYSITCAVNDGMGGENTATTSITK